MTKEVENQETLQREFRIKVGQATNKQTGEKFNTYRVLRKDGKFMKLKFRKEVKEVKCLSKGEL